MLSPKTLQFLEDLKENNNREWFLANKSYYEEYKKEYHQLISDFLEEMVPFDDSLRNLESKKCAFRINRDIRFSKDKSPYKTHMGIWMTTDQNRSNSPGYYVHIEKGGSFIAVGLHVPEAADLKKVRKEIAYFYEDLEEIVNDKDFKKIYPELDRTEANSLKTAPKDYEKDHPAIEFLKLKSFTVSQKLDDKSLFEKDFVKKTAKKLITAKPLNDFLTRGLNTE
jgi:TIGR02453 family protein